MNLNINKWFISNSSGSSFLSFCLINMKTMYEVHIRSTFILMICHCGLIPSYKE